MKWFILAFLCLFATGTVCAHQNPTVLTYATPYSPKHPFSLADKRFIQRVEKQSGGSLIIKPIWSGTLISSAQSMLELRHGVADMGLITPIYVRGGAHLLRVQTGFYSGAETYEQQVALYRCLAAASPEYDHELEGLKILTIQGGTLPGLLTCNRPVRTLNDLKGMRIRVPAELLSVMQDLGVDAVSAPMGEVYSALAKGVLDGVVAPCDTLKSLHFAEVAKYFTRLKIPRGAYPARAMSLDCWQMLSRAQRNILEKAVPFWEAALADEVKKADAAGQAEGRRMGVTFIDIAAKEQERFDAIYEKDGLRNARALDRFGINGEEIFRKARRISSGIELTGKVICGD